MNCLLLIIVVLNFAIRWIFRCLQIYIWLHFDKTWSFLVWTRIIVSLIFHNRISQIKARRHMRFLFLASASAWRTPHWSRSNSTIKCKSLCEARFHLFFKRWTSFNICSSSCLFVRNNCCFSAKFIWFFGWVVYLGDANVCIGWFVEVKWTCLLSNLQITWVLLLADWTCSVSLFVLLLQSQSCLDLLDQIVLIICCASLCKLALFFSNFLNTRVQIF